MKKRVFGQVKQGDGIAGKEFGVPTANLDVSVSGLEYGVYAAYVDYNGARYGGVVCYGVGEPPKFEVHLLDFSGHLVGNNLDVEIVQHVSDLVPWKSKEQMAKKISDDIKKTRNILALSESLTTNH